MEEKYYNILHFEENNVTNFLCQHLFEKQLFTYTSCEIPSSKEELVTLVINAKPDLILMNIDMSEMDGFTATKILKNDSRIKDIPIFGFGDKTDKETFDEAKDCGMNDYYAHFQFLWPTAPHYDSFFEELIKRVKKYFKSPDSYEAKFDEYKSIQKVQEKQLEEKPVENKPAEQRPARIERQPAENVGNYNDWAKGALLLIWIILFYNVWTSYPPSSTRAGLVILILIGFVWHLWWLAGKPQD